MKFIKLTLIFATCLAIFACNEVSETADKAKQASEDVAKTMDKAMEPIKDAFDTEPSTGANYGAGIAADANIVSFASFLNEISEKDSLTAVVEGEVVEVCQKKGCWMSMIATGDTSKEMTVRFKDYGFFMPKNLSGSKVAIEGTAKRRIVPVDELRHYAEDAGKSAEEIAQINSPEEELEFIATGVRVL